MAEINRTLGSYFVLSAFSDFHQLQILFFIIFQLAYMICITANIIIIILVNIKPSLNTPMYFFISTLSALEIMFSSSIVPKLLDNLISCNKTISFIDCFIQLFISDTLGATECFLLAVMAFDRDLAINNPIHYSTIMNMKFCITLAILPWIMGAAIVFIPTVFTANMEFCGLFEINHFYCDLVPLQILACSDKFIVNIVTSLTAIFATIFPFLIIMGFYIHIIHTILKIKGVKGKQKAFSTCSSHLIVASLFYITAIVVYIGNKGGNYDKFISLSYTVLTPLFNPFIYALRNKEILFFSIVYMYIEVINWLRWTLICKVSSFLRP
ncbi:hypothetical protein XELAEV_18040258mg [Xenopus laevis]|uniref:G-protein coupled receptors family 1 profile domain-containing protein n=1 Tax=Xenopus laevis TaxID=8355 RepID=A0A974C958_XENLA|nr:hypothetical protein XELAEV_18040258mg [Xenopus laevis]